MSTRTSRADQNFLSLSDNEAVWFAGTPNEQHGDLPNPITLVPINPQGWDAILKISYSTDLHLWNVAIAQGKENVVDINRMSSGVAIQGELGLGGGEGDQVITVKGGSWGIMISGAVHSQGRKATVVVGTWSDQSHDTSHHLDFTGLYRVDGKPVTFILGRVNNPIRAMLGHPTDIQLPHGARVLFWRSLGEQAYFWLKLAAVKIGVLS